MTRTTASRKPHLTAIPTGPAAGGHIQPTDAQRAAAEAFLRDAPVETEIREPLKRALASFGDVENNYIAEARRQGEQARIWDTTGWIIANAIAREAALPRRS